MSPSGFSELHVYVYSKESESKVDVMSQVPFEMLSSSPDDGNTAQEMGEGRQQYAPLFASVEDNPQHYRPSLQVLFFYIQL